MGLADGIAWENEYGSHKIINNQSSMDEKIEKAISLLRDNDYIVIKMTPRMIRDSNECESMAECGKDKDCIGCSCNRCVVQG